MSVLYPRLLDRSARALHQECSTSTIQELADRAALRHRLTVYAATGGRRVTESELSDLRAMVLELARAVGHPGPSRRQDRATFDNAAGRLLHERSGLVAAEAAVRDAWSFLALVVLPDVAYWRFPSPPMDRVLGTDITRHVFGRLWWRAHLLEDPRASADHRYDLMETFSEAAFDQIFARRRSIGGSRAVVRQLARAWPSFDRAGLNERDVLRDVLKRLLRRGAFVEFESLTEEQLDRLITDAMSQSVQLMLEESGNVERRRHAV